jgi:hypothetical protein
MIIIKFFGVNNFNKISDSTKSLDLTKKNKSPKITISAHMPITTLVLNHILKFKILYILGFILLFILLLPITWPFIYTFLHILIVQKLPDSNFEYFYKAIYESRFLGDFFNRIDPNFTYRTWHLKFRSSSWLLSGCNKPSTALDFFLLDETSNLEDLGRKKNLKLRITNLPENKNITDEIRMRILQDRLEIIYYYLVAKHYLGSQIDKNKPIDLSELDKNKPIDLSELDKNKPIDWSELDRVKENFVKDLTNQFQKRINFNNKIVWQSKNILQ